MPTSLDEIFRLIRSGQFEPAEQQCRSALQRAPDDVNVLGLYGAILLKLGRNEEAAPALERTIELAPEFAKPYEDLGYLCLDQGDLQRATDLFAKAIELDASQANAHHGYALALAGLGRTAEAEAARARFLNLSPVQGWLAEAGKRAAAGQFEDAEKICQRALAEQPDNREALRMLAKIASDDERPLIAEGLLKKVIRLSPGSAAACNEFGRFLGEQGRFPEAIEQFEQAISVDPGDADNYRYLGDSLSVLRRYTEALQAYDQALELRSDDCFAQIGRGHMLRVLGRRDEAVAAYEASIELEPLLGDPWWSLASMRGYRLNEERVSALRSLLGDDRISRESEVSFRFAAARACEAAGDYAAAWSEYERGNRLKRSQIQYDPVQTEMTHDALISFFGSDFLRDRQSTVAVEPAPIFIVGLPRSGSTLVEQILSSHSHVEGTGELPYVIMMSGALGGQRTDGLRYPEILMEMSARQMESLGKNYSHNTRLHRHHGLPRFTDKLPANFSHVGLIHLTMPNAKIIDARRNPLDTLIANFRQLFAQGKNQSYDLSEFAEYYLEYDRMMQHWDKVLPGKVLRVRYENVVPISRLRRDACSRTVIYPGGRLPRVSQERPPGEHDQCGTGAGTDLP